MTSENRRGGAARISRPLTFQQAIEKAEENGANRDEMVLRLTSRDAADLKRDKTIAVADISFTGGVMRFLGVKVVQGGLEASALDISGKDFKENDVVVAKPAKATKAKTTKAKTTKASKASTAVA